MENVIKKSAIFIVLAITTVASVLVLDIVSVDVEKNTMFYTVFAVLILAISALIIVSISNSSKKQE